MASRIARWRARPRFKAPRSAVLLPALLAAGLLITLAPRVPSPPPAPASAHLAAPTPPVAPPAPTAADTLEPGCPHGCAEPPPGCVIKGNLSWKTGERIYHMPGQRFYGRTVISPAKGEAWFCTEAEAQANGWRKSMR
jgi:hypothetical protein